MTNNLLYHKKKNVIKDARVQCAMTIQHHLGVSVFSGFAETCPLHKTWPVNKIWDNLLSTFKKLFKDILNDKKLQDVMQYFLSC